MKNEIAAVEVETIEPNATHVSFANYIRGKGYDISDESVALTFVFHAEWQGSDARRAERESVKAAKESARLAAKAKREAERRERLADEKAKLEAKLAKLAGPTG